ncbi:MAG: hydrogenase maturation nickel metallochaperone HypA [archaeon]|nr:hydrogenase maturation nickel metallochaperone HypA [archaeon]MCP8315137.1 hydrogenase maturation nickel metallochaperone HypA [archaeon]MCP8316171.1 hydrogenase maturation nickel metallochaperone HypA [archaeon]MCP8319762.1 hydrogenase maturation nickel metallochaperone HypA [archaeon]
MHEISLAFAIFETAKGILKEKEGKEVIELEIELGGLTMISPLQLKFALETIFEDESPFKNCKIKIDAIEPIFECKKCKHSWRPNLSSRSPMISHLENLSCVHCMDTYFAFMICPNCGSNEVDVISGKECVIKGIKIMK